MSFASLGCWVWTRPGHDKLEIISSWLCSGLQEMTLISVQLPMDQYVHHKPPFCWQWLANLLADWAILPFLPSQTIASDRAWLHGCMICFKGPIGFFLGTNSTGSQSFRNSTLGKHCKPPDRAASFWNGRCLSEKPIHFWAGPETGKQSTSPLCEETGCGLKLVFQ